MRPHPSSLSRARRPGPARALPLLLALALVPAATAQPAGLVAGVTATAEPLDGFDVRPLPGSPLGAFGTRSAGELRRRLAARRNLLKDGVCLGEAFAVTVETRRPDGAGSVHVTIDGYPGERRFLQLAGEPGPRRIHVAAAAEDGRIESRSLEVTVEPCEVTPVPRVRSRFNPYRPHTVDFTIENHDEVGRAFNGYLWDFGDGSRPVATLEPYASHFYGDRTDAAAPAHAFVVTVRPKAPAAGREGAARRYAVTLLNNEHQARRQGIARPRVTTSGRMEPRGDALVGRYAIRNLEPEPLLFTGAAIEHQPCDPSRRASGAVTTPRDVVFRGGFDLDRGVRRGELARRADGVRRTLPWLPAGALVLPPRAGAAPPAAPMSPGTPVTVVPSPPAVAGTPVAVPPAGPVVGRPPSSPGVTVAPTGPGAGATRPGVLVPGAGTRPGLDVTFPGGALPNAGTELVVVPASQVHEGFLTIGAAEVPQGVCGIGYHLTGRTPSGLAARASLYFEVRENPFLTRRLTDPAMRRFLVEVARRGLVPDRARITTEDLYRLERQGKVRRTAAGWEVL